MNNMYRDQHGAKGLQTRQRPAHRHADNVQIQAVTCLQPSQEGCMHMREYVSDS